ncbi:MAG: VCBS repeat-containing protein, partial [Kiritimatiellae bacterium]|nr:VCBS repeat-containing protein [Kiritimatiellia bacterium]
MIRHAFMLLVAVLALSAAHAETNQYTIYLVEVDMSLPNLANGCAAWGDYDQDGFMDLFFSGRNTNGLMAALYRNLDGTTYSNVNVSIPGGEGSSADWGDFDNDGDPDLIYCAYTTNQTHSTYLFRNDGDGAFTEITNHPFPGVSSGSVQWGDYDQDGLPDVALCGYQSGGTNLARIYRNLGAGTFSTNPIQLTGVRDGHLIWHDFNGDGYSDLLLHGDTGSGRITKFYRNEQGASFSNLTTTTIPGIALGCVDWVDVDCDGYDDLSLAGYAASGPIGRLYRGEGSNGTSFTLLATNVPPGAWLGSTTWGDYDNDGDPDLLISGINTQNTSLTHLYLNEGSGTLTQVAIALPPQKQSRNQWVDLNGDDILDLFMCGRNTNGQYRTYT